MDLVIEFDLDLWRIRKGERDFDFDRCSFFAIERDLDDFLLDFGDDSVCFFLSLEVDFDLCRVGDGLFLEDELCDVCRLVMELAHDFFTGEC